MKMFYVTVNDQEAAKKISLDLLENKLAACTNWFPITSAYRWDGEIKQADEVVLIIKTRDGMRREIEKTIAKHVNYTNFIAEIDVDSVNSDYLQWLQTEVP